MEGNVPKKRKKSPVVVSVINLKGGVGKTTVAALLARHAARKLHVLAVDLDSQANLSQALMTENDYKRFMEDRQPSIVELFRGYLPPSSERPAPAPLNQVIRTVVGHEDNLHLIPSRFDFSDYLISSIKPDERVLAKFIADEMGERNLILIDCAPTESIFTRTAYHASRYILVPVRTEFFSTIGFPLLKESLEKFKSHNPGHAIDVCGVLINNSGTREAKKGPHQEDAEKDIREKAKEYGWRIMEQEMFFSRGYPKMMKDAYPTYLRNAEYEFPKIADEFMTMVGL